MFTFPIGFFSPVVVSGDPSTIFGSSLQLWLRGDSIVLNGSNVSQWTDKSGNSNHATQTNASLQPAYQTTGFNGKPCLNFNNVAVMNLPNFLQSSWGEGSLIVLYYLSTTADQWCVMQTGSGGDPYWGTNGTFGYSSYFGEFMTARLNGQPSSGMSIVGQALVEVISGTGSNSYILNRNTTNLLTTNPNWGVTTTPVIGESIGGGKFFPGTIAEIVLINTVPTTSQLTAIRAYFKNYYSLNIY